MHSDVNMYIDTTQKASDALPYTTSPEADLPLLAYAVGGLLLVEGNSGSRSLPLRNVSPSVERHLLVLVTLPEHRPGCWFQKKVQNTLQQLFFLMSLSRSVDLHSLPTPIPPPKKKIKK